LKNRVAQKDVPPIPPAFISLLLFLDEILATPAAEKNEHGGFP
jgi:hypothetical protein